MKFRSASPYEFLMARARSPYASFFTPYDDPNELNSYVLLLSQDGKSGAAVGPAGDIQSVFNNSGVPGAGSLALEAAILRGGRSLDCFDGRLADFYRKHGFVETGRVAFDPKLAPPTWNYERDGTPDVVFMVLKRSLELRL